MPLAEILTPFNITLGILAVASVFFVNGRVRADLVALCTMLALMLTNVLEPAEALAGFSNSVVIMMVGLFVVGAGIFRTGLAKMISSKILQLAGHNEDLLLILVMIPTASIGAFVSNTGTVALMMPIVISMAASAGISIRRYLMPMAFASSMGLFTLISTTPNLVIQDVLIQGGFEPLSFFSFAPIGAITVTLGIFLLFFLSKILKTKDDGKESVVKKTKSLAELVEDYNLPGEVYKIGVPESSAIAGKTVGDLKIATTYDISIGLIVRRGAPGIFSKNIPEEIAGPNTVIMDGDTLFCSGSETKIAKFVEDNALQLQKIQDKEIKNSFQNYGIAEAFITPNSSIINHTVKDSRFRERYDVTVLGIKCQGGCEIGEIKDIKLRAGDSILIQGSWDKIAALADNREDLVIIGQPEKEAQKVTLDRKAPMAGTIMILMILVMALDLMPAVTAVLLAAVLMVGTGCLRNMEEAYESINWSSIVLIGAMIPLATAFEKTGITNVIANFLTNGLGDIGNHGLLAIIYLFTSLLTMFLSNTATTILFAPIAIKTAITVGVSPHPFLFAVAVAATLCYASPFSTPPNALVMSAGKYSFMDYIKVGLPLQILMGIIMILILPYIFPF